MATDDPRSIGLLLLVSGRVYNNSVKSVQIILSFIPLPILQAATSSSSPGRDQAEVVIHTSTGLTTMAGGSKRVAAAALVGLCVLVVLAMVAEPSDAAGVCNPNALLPCMKAVQGTRPAAPSQQCCNVVRTADKNCMCNQLKSTSFPAQMVNNGLQLPKKCGRSDLRGFICGRYTFPF